MFITVKLIKLLKLQFKMEGEDSSTSCGLGDIIPATPDNEKYAKKLKKSVKKRHLDLKWQCDAEIVPPVELETFVELKNSKGRLESQMYVFHSFDSVLKYKPKSKPINCYIKIIGHYKTSRTSIPYIQGYDATDQKFAIFVDFELVELTPQINDVVEIFGHLEFRTVVKHSMPIFMVHFWIKLSNSISSYIQCLRMQRRFLTEDAFGVEIEPEDMENDSLVELMQDISFGIISMMENKFS